MLAYHLPKKLKPIGCLVLLAAFQIIIRERLRLDEREERLDERLLLMERLDDRDEGIPHTYDAENNFSANGQLGKEGDVTFSSLSNAWLMKPYYHEQRWSRTIHSCQATWCAVTAETRLSIG